MSELAYSHVIPNGFFRLLFQGSGGSGIGVPLGAGQISGTQDSGKAPLLCKQCESHFNRCWDGPLVNAMKDLDNKIQNNGFGARLCVDHNQFAQAVASIIWRSCVTAAPMYHKSNIDTVHLAALRRIIEVPSDDALKHCSVILRRLWDRTTLNGNGFDQKSIADFIVTPTPRTYVLNGKPRGFGFDFVVRGFLIQIAIPRLPHAIASQSGLLKANQDVLHAPRINIFDYQPLKDMMVRTWSKIDAGEVSGKAAS